MKAWGYANYLVTLRMAVSSDSELALSARWPEHPAAFCRPSLQYCGGRAGGCSANLGPYEPSIRWKEGSVFRVQQEREAPCGKFD